MPYGGGVGAVDGVGRAARFDGPSDVTIDSLGNIYVADSGNKVIRKVSSAGVVTTFAGIRPSHGLVDGTGSNARFHMPSAITLDSSGNLFVSDSYQSVIRRVTPSGSVTTLPLVNNDLAWPLGLAFDKQGNLYVADSYNYAVRMIATDGVMTKVADLQSMPIGLAIDSTGNVFVSQTASIVKIAPGGAKSVFVGGTLGSADGVGGAAQFNCVYGLAVDRQDNLYAADYYGQAIRKISPTGVVTTVAGQLGKVGEVDGPAGTALLECPTSVTVDASGTIYFTERFSESIRQATPDGTVTTLARHAYKCGGVSMLQGPAGIVVDAQRNLYIADSGENIVTKATLALRLTLQPENGILAEGQTVRLSASAIGDGMPAASFQWQVSANRGVTWNDLTNVGPYSGVATDTLTITGATTALNGHQFRCLASNVVYRKVESGTATLTVYPSLGLSMQSRSVSVAEGQPAQFSVAVMGDGMPTTSFRWQVSADRGGTWSNIWDDWYYRGYNTETLTIRAATAALNGYQYRCLGSNAAQSNVASDVATLTIETNAPIFNISPHDCRVWPGSRVSFYVSAYTSVGDVAYRWQESRDGVQWNDLYDGGIYAGTQAQTFYVATSPEMSGWSYRCIASAGGLQTVSAAAVVAFESPLSWWRQRNLGTEANFGAAADDADPDLDGRCNLLEYALGSVPTVADQGNAAECGLVTDGAGTHLTLTFNRIVDPNLGGYSDPTPTYTVEASDDLTTWTQIWTRTGMQNVVGSVVVTDAETVETHPLRFLRLRVSN